MKGCRPFSEVEVSRILEALVGRHACRDRALFVLGLYTGFRIAELLSIRVGDVWDGVAVLDRLHVARRNMKRHVEGRTVPLHSRAREALKGWLDAWGPLLLDPAAPLFGRHVAANSAITQVAAWRLLKRAYARAGLKGPGLATHSMRKSFAARIYQNVGHDLVKTQAAMGHRNINSTVSYISFLDSDIDRAILAA
jgi:integrase